MAPKAIGASIGAPFFSAETSSSLSAGSEPAKSTVPAVNCETPAPEPTDW